MDSLDILDTSADVIVHLLRAYDDDSITHFYETVDPLRDLRIVQNEIMMRVLHLQLFH